MIDVRQTPQYAKHLKTLGWKVERIEEINYFIKKIPLLGNVLKVQRPERIDYQALSVLTKKYRPFQIIVEPNKTNDAFQLLKQGYKLSKHPYLPSKTLHLDLTLDKKELLKQMKKDCRQSIRKNEQQTVENCNKLNDFRNAWKKAVDIKRYIPPLSHLSSLKNAFKENALFLLSKNSSSGAIFLCTENIAYYWQAFTDREGRKERIQYKVVWEAVLRAKQKGAKILDFEGIFDERFPNRSWKGFTHFKESFGGREVTYPGAFLKTRLFR